MGGGFLLVDNTFANHQEKPVGRQRIIITQATELTRQRRQLGILPKHDPSLLNIQNTIQATFQIAFIVEFF